MSTDNIHHGSALQEGVTGDPDTIYKSAQADGAPKPQTDEAVYFTDKSPDHDPTRPLLDQPASEVELYDPTV